MSPELENLVADTIALTGASPPQMLAENAPVLSNDAVADDDAESMYLVGLIGGKDVGKSSFVNALVGQEISEQTSHGPGTEVVVVYAHESTVPQLREFLDREVPGRFKIYAHTVARLLRQVLVDLPDIDSIYGHHVDLTRRMLRHMIYPIWIQSVEKYADQQPQKLLARVAEGNDPANFIFCLNKLDQLVGRDGLAAGVQLRDDYSGRLARLLNLPSPPRVHLVSAQNPTDYDFPALRDLLSKQKTVEALTDSHQLAGRQGARTILAWIDSQNLPERAARIARLRESAEELLAGRLAVPILEDALPRLAEDPAYRLSIIDPVVNARMSHWPIVNVLHGLLSPLLAAIRPHVPSGEVKIDPYLSIEGDSLPRMVQAAFAQIQQTSSSVSGLYAENKWWESMPAENAAADLQGRFSGTLRRQREAVLDRIGRQRGFIAPFFRVLLTVGALLWFPLVQPMLEIVLQNDMTHMSRELLFKIVQLLGVTFLLKNLTFLLLYFTVLWAIVRAAAQRRAAGMISRWQKDPKLDPSLSFAGQTLEWIDELLDPIQRQQDQVEALIARTEKLRESLPTRAAA